ncbi:MAG: P1 family peptidase [Pseudomonadota bacterium]
MIRPGPLNSITDVAGISVGQAEDRDLLTGVTAVVAAEPAVAAASVMGGAPGTRAVSILGGAETETRVDAVVLSGGSAFGLDACGGAMEALRARGRGFAIGDVRVPIVPGAIIFDLMTGGAKGWAAPPWHRLGRMAVEVASAEVALGNAGAGIGARAGGLKGGVGTASYTDGTVTVGAIAVVNAIGSAVMPGSRRFWAWPFEEGVEFGGLGPPAEAPGAARFQLKMPMSAGDGGRQMEGCGDADRRGTMESTTLAVVATDAALTRAETGRLAVMAQDGMARAVYPVHGPLDGDTIFALSTGAGEAAEGLAGLTRLGTLAGDCVARAIARGVFAADAIAGLPGWSSLAEDGTVLDDG